MKDNLEYDKQLDHTKAVHTHSNLGSICISSGLLIGIFLLFFQLIWISTSSAGGSDLSFDQSLIPGKLLGFGWTVPNDSLNLFSCIPNDRQDRAWVLNWSPSEGLRYQILRAGENLQAQGIMPFYPLVLDSIRAASGAMGGGRSEIWAGDDGLRVRVWTFPSPRPFYAQILLGDSSTIDCVTLWSPPHP